MADETGFIKIRGIQVRSGQASVFPIDQLYIPLTAAGGGADGDWPLEAELRHADPGKGRERLARSARPGSGRVALDQALQSRWLVIIGDPGSGKTTFVNRISHHLCRGLLDPALADEIARQLGFDHLPFPVVIRAADLVEHQRAARQRNQGPHLPDAPGWIVHYLAEQCRENWHGLDPPFLEKLLDDGRAIVLLDGLDEAPTEALRENLSKLIRRAARAWNKCRWVVTSRPAAYHDDVVLHEFDQVQIDRLDEAAIATFLRRWYSALFPDSPGQAAYHGDQLLEALRDRLEIRLLARNPVMLTALGVVHWNEQRLPEQRAELYEATISASGT